MHGAIARLERAEQDLARLIDMCTEKRNRQVFSKLDISNDLGIRSEKIRNFISENKKNEKNDAVSGASRRRTALSTGEFWSLLRFVEERRDDIRALSGEAAKAFDRIFEVVGGPVDNSIEYVDVVDLAALVEATQAPQQMKIYIKGRYLTFRRMPSTDNIMVSALEVLEDPERQALIWKNKHPLSRGFVEYSGIVGYSSDHFIMLGQREDARSIDALALRLPDVAPTPATQINEWHGIAFVETSNIPTCSRLYMVSRKESLDDLQEHCGIKGFDYCRDLGLSSKNLIDIFDLPGGNLQDFHERNSQAFTARNY
ncbi:hypothetical protein [Palleronia pelagia]|uniref:Uncharacterized protein n=1 Tax=Palleronia pelagia TaxID=387096 RepID=A0A1H8MEL4_9RHOB|nr:hypothetical protein [Palleronia pelagia]SEO15616.1 hypothetical protein SAMN04488011_1165 [Palleronia pelagia]